MPGTSAPRNPAIKELNDGHLSPRSGRQPLSILGLSIVSGMNVACLAFLAHHFASHPQEPIVTPTEYHKVSDASDADPPPQTQAALGEEPGVFGNVDLASAPRNVINIAAGFDLTDRKLLNHRENTLTFAELDGSEEIESSSADEPSDHWVQLGALSKEMTARRYWSDLKLRHKSLLQDREPRYFGPMEVGGNLYHVRLGPMAGEAAAGLCEKLEAEEVDCFCVGPHDDGF